MWGLNEQNSTPTSTKGCSVSSSRHSKKRRKNHLKHCSLLLHNFEPLYIYNAVGFPNKRKHLRAIIFYKSEQNQ